MTDEKIKIFSERIASSNRTGIIAVLFDIYREYSEEAIFSLEKNDDEGFKKGIGHAEDVILHLKHDLDFSFEISFSLYSLYQYVLSRLARAVYLKSSEPVEEASRIMDSLGEAFRELAKNDDSAPLIKNAEKVYYGMTYGKKDINKMSDSDESRGFLV